MGEFLLWKAKLIFTHLEGKVELQAADIAMISIWVYEGQNSNFHIREDLTNKLVLSDNFNCLTLDGWVLLILGDLKLLKLLDLSFVTL